MTSLVERAPIGRAGPRVSPLALATDGFGGGVPDDVAVAMLARYLDGGGNHVLTSETSERLVGRYLRSSARRGEVMLATGASEPRPSAADGDARGTRARISGGVEASLRRLGVERVDLCWARPWDGRTPAEEVVSIAEDLARAGKIRHLGLADVPAWYLARVKTLAGVAVISSRGSCSLTRCGSGSSSSSSSRRRSPSTSASAAPGPSRGAS